MTTIRQKIDELKTNSDAACLSATFFLQPMTTDPTDEEWQEIKDIAESAMEKFEELFMEACEQLGGTEAASTINQQAINLFQKMRRKRHEKGILD